MCIYIYIYISLLQNICTCIHFHSTYIQKANTEYQEILKRGQVVFIESDQMIILKTQVGRAGIATGPNLPRTAVHSFII